MNDAPKDQDVHQAGAIRGEPEAAGQGMPGLLKAMRWAYHSYYVKGYSNSDERDAYVSALEDDLPALFGQVDDLVALVGRLVRSLRKAAPGNALADGAMDYLRRKGLSPSPLRTAEPPQAASGCSHTARSDGQNGGEQGATPPAPAAPAAEGGAS